MSIETVQNVKPLSPDLEWDLGEVLKCAWNDGCEAEAEWIVIHTCKGCQAYEESPLCTPHKTVVEEVGRRDELMCMICRTHINLEELEFKKL